MSKDYKKLRRIFATSVTTAMVVSAFAPVAFAATDVPADSRYSDAVSFLKSKGVTGFTDGTFKPHQQISRVDAAVMLVKVLELDIEAAPQSGFKDVPARATKYVNALKHAGITNGTSIETFNSQAAITRGELAIWIARAFELKASGSTLAFTDVSERYIESVKSLVENGITLGKTANTFGTTSNATRGEYALFLQRANNLSVVKTINTPGEVGENIELAPIGSANIVYGPETGTTTIKGNLTIKGDAKGTITLRNIVVNGELTVNTPNASVVVESNTKVTGTTYVKNVLSNTFTNKGTLGNVVLEDHDGTRFVNDKDATIGSLTVRTTGNVTLGGSIPSVVVEQAGELKIEGSTSIGNIKANGNVVIDLPESSTIDTIEAEAAVELNGKGKVTVISGSKANEVKGNNDSIFDAINEGAPSVPSEPKNFTLSLMHTNDTHANLDNVAKRVTAVKEVKAEKPDALLVDAGDVFSGTLYFNEFQGQADLTFMNLMGYDIMTLGNHEFDLGSSPEGHKALADFIKGAKFSFVSSNVDYSKDTNLQGLFSDIISSEPENGKIYNGIVKEINGEKVGFFGLTTAETAAISSPGDVTFEDYIAEAEKAVKAFEGMGVNKIVAITHIGYDDNPVVDNDLELAAKVDGIDVIVGGHSHTRLEEPVVVDKDENGEEKDATLIVQAYQYNEVLGTLDVEFDSEGKIVSHAGELIAIADYQVDAEAAEALKPYAAKIEEVKTTETGATAKFELKNPRLSDANSDGTSVRANETPLGNLITDGMLAKAKQYDSNVIMAMQNGGGIRAAINEGPITVGEVITVLPFGNTLATMELTGAELKEAFEISLGSLPRENGGFLHVSGAKVEYNSTKPAGERVVSISYKNEDGTYTAIKADETYTIATNAFTAKGGDGYSVFAEAYEEGRVTDLGLSDWENLRDHVASLKEVAPVVEGRIVDVSTLPTDLIISEYVEGSSFNKAIELYNGTGSAIDLSNYSLELYSNGALNPSRSVELSGTIESGKTFIVYHAQASAEIKNKGHLESTDATNFNGDDPVVLRKGDQVVDSIGKVGADRFMFGENVTLVRNNNITTGDTIIDDAFDASAWTKLAQNDFSNLGIREVGGTAPGEPDPVEPPPGEKLTINDIQGTSHKSPHEGKSVAGVEGIVTYVDGSNKFYIQSQSPDNDVKTSDGLEVFMRNHGVEVGDVVAVSGKVSEYRSSSRTNDLTTTQIEGTHVETKAKGQVLPEAIVLDVDRKIPTETIDDDGFASFDPEADGIDFYESIEGMLVQVNNPKIVAPQAYGDLVVVPETIATTNDFGGLNITFTDYNPERITLNLNKDSIQADAGDQINGNVTGTVAYDFGNYVIQTNSNDLPEIVPSGKKVMEDSTTIEFDENKLTVASYNIENFAVGDSRVTDIAKSIVNNLKSPDIVQLSEVQDDSGATDNGIVSAERSYQAIIDEIKKLSGKTYAYTEVAPEDKRDGGAPGGNIRVGIIYNTDRVELTEGATAGSSTDSVEYKDNSLTLNPGRIDPTNDAFEASRKPFAAQFTFKPTGEEVIVIAAHFNSKGGDQQLFGDVQPPVLSSEVQRNKIAKIVNDFVTDIHTKNPDANVIIAGDLNDFEFSNPLQVTAGDVLTNMIDQVPAGDRFTYFYQGNSQVLDHILVSNRLADATEVDIVHTNSPFYNQISDHDPVLVQVDLSAGHNEEKELEIENLEVKDNGDNTVTFSGKLKDATPGTTVYAVYLGGFEEPLGNDVVDEEGNFSILADGFTKVTSFNYYLFSRDKDGNESGALFGSYPKE